MVLNLTERVARMSATVLDVSPTATRQEVVEALTNIVGVPAEQWLAVQPTAPLPASLTHRRAIAAARVLTCHDKQRSSRVVEFLNADYKLPPLQRVVPPVVEDTTIGLQLPLIA